MKLFTHGMDARPVTLKGAGLTFQLGLQALAVCGVTELIDEILFAGREDRNQRNTQGGNAGNGSDKPPALPDKETRIEVQYSCPPCPCLI